MTAQHEALAPILIEVKATPAAPSAMPSVAAIFALADMDRFFRHPSTAGPNLGCRSIHASNLGEPCAKQPAAKMTKIVVGISGRNAPMIPSARNPQPAAIHRIRVALRLSVGFSIFSAS